METQITQTEFKINDEVEIISIKQCGLSKVSLGQRGKITNIDEEETGPLKYVVKMNTGAIYFLGDQNIKSIN